MSYLKRRLRARRRPAFAGLGSVQSQAYGLPVSRSALGAAAAEYPLVTASGAAQIKTTPPPKPVAPYVSKLFGRNRPAALNGMQEYLLAPLALPSQPVIKKTARAPSCCDDCSCAGCPDCPPRGVRYAPRTAFAGVSSQAFGPPVATSALGSLGADDTPTIIDPQWAQDMLASQREMVAAHQEWVRRDEIQRMLQLAATLSIPLAAAIWRALGIGRRRKPL